MIDQLIIILQTNFLPLGALGVFVATFIEEVVAPIPSAIITISSGFLFLSGPFSFDLVWRMIAIVALPTALGMTLGSIVIYFIGYFGGKPVIIRWGKFLGVSWDSIAQTQKRLDGQRKDEAVLFIVRVLPIVPSVVIGLIAGLIRYNLKTFVLITFIGSLIRAIGLACVGWIFGVTYYQYADVIGRFEYVGLIILIGISLVLFIWYKNRRSSGMLS